MPPATEQQSTLSKQETPSEIIRWASATVLLFHTAIKPSVKALAHWRGTHEASLWPMPVDQIKGATIHHILHKILRQKIIGKAPINAADCIEHAQMFLTQRDFGAG